MSVILILIPVSMVVAACFLAGFIWAVRSGQYEDTCTPSMRVLLDEAENPLPSSSRSSNSTLEPVCAGIAEASTPNKALVGLHSESSTMVQTTKINVQRAPGASVKNFTR